MKSPRLAVCANDDKHIVILAPDGQKLTSITADGGFLSLGSGSPYGRRPLFTAGGSYTQQGLYWNNVAAVFVGDVQTHRSRQLTQRRGGDGSG